MRLRFTNPWWVVVGAVIGLFVCNGPVLAFTFGVFLKPIMVNTGNTGWQRGSVSFALSVGGIFAAIVVPILGRMMDRWSIRRVALPGIVVYSVCLGLVGPSPKVFWVFTLLDLTGSYNAAFTGAGAALVAAVVLVNRLGAYAYPVEREAGLDFAVEPAAALTAGGERA